MEAIFYVRPQFGQILAAGTGNAMPSAQRDITFRNDQGHRLTKKISAIGVSG